MSLGEQPFLRCLPRLDLLFNLVKGLSVEIFTGRIHATQLALQSRHFVLVRFQLALQSLRL